MKKVIDGKVYDTETATLKAEWENMYDARNFNYVEEQLYQKKTGEFFLYGYGGPCSKYAKTVGQNTWTSGEKIMPLSYEAAKEWTEEHCDGDKYEEIFGEIDEDGEVSYVQYRISNAAQEKAKRAAAKAGVGLSEWIEKIINEMA